jgi:polysaccharide export outer membrane protein
MKQFFSNSKISLYTLIGFALATSPAAPVAAAQQMAPAVSPAAQQQAIAANNVPPAGQAADPQLKQSPLKSLQAFEPAADEEYELGPGDEINLDVPGHAELNGKHIVGPDGRITLPVAGTIMIANQTRSGASQTIKDALTPYYTDVTVTLGIDKYGSNHIMILGNVQHPGVLYYDSTPTLLDAIARGGLMANSSNKDGIPDRCMIYRGNDQTLTVELRKLLQGGNAMADIRLRRNDIIFVPVQQEEFISMMGEVKAPGAIPLTQNLSLHQAIAQAGGITEYAGKNVEIVQYSTGKTIIIPYNQILTPNGDREITLHGGDIVAIPKSGLAKWSTVMTRLSPITSMATLATIAH